jgi:outer membrane protein assembly factor BamB
LYSIQRPRARFHLLLFFMLVSLLLAACGDIVGADNWPGMSANGDRVYIAHGTRVTAVDVTARQQLWSFPQEASPAQFYAAPSLQEGRLIVGDYGASQGFFSPGLRVSIYALEDTNSGLPRILWETDEPARGRVVAPPLQVNNQVFIGTDDNELIALDAQSGAVRWRFNTGHSVWAQPLYEEGVLYVASLDKTLYALNAETGEEIWRQLFSGALAGRPAFYQGRLYVGSFAQQVHVLDAATGEEQWVIPAGDWVWGSPVVADGVLYLADISGNIFAVGAEDGERLWVQNVPGAVQADPVVVDGGVYIVSAAAAANGGRRMPEQGVVTAFAVDDGRILWQQNTRVPLFTTPVVVGESLVVVVDSDDALLHVYSLQDGSLQWMMPAVAAR